MIWPRWGRKEFDEEFFRAECERVDAEGRARLLAKVRPEVVPFRDSAVDIVASLRGLADRIDAGEYGPVRFLSLALVSGRDEIAIFCYGKASNLEISGTFARAASIVGCAVPDMAVVGDAEPKEGA